MITAPHLPVVFSVPHGGLEVPVQVKKHFRLDLPAILRDSDTWSGCLFDFNSQAQACFQFPIARAVLDLNRAPDDRPPVNKDGVVKTVTVLGEQIWHDPRGLPDSLVDILLERYYYPYHHQLSVASGNRRVFLGIDCHTMLNEAPANTENPGAKRPLVCISNRGDQNGEPRGEPTTAPGELIRAFGHVLEKNLQKLRPEHSEPVVVINDPFYGGYITKKHGTSDQIPWIQLEINRSLYLVEEPWGPGPGEATLKRMEKVKQQLLKSIYELFGV